VRKLAQILYSGLGGHGSVVFSLITAGRESWTHALGFLGVEPLLEEYRQRCTEGGMAFRYFPAFAGRPWTQWRAVQQWLTQQQPDAILCHSGSALLPSAAYARLRGIPLVFVEHTPLATKPAGEWAASRLAMLLADRIVMLTPAYAKAVHRRLGRFYRPGKVVVIPNGIDTDQFHPGRSRPLGGTVRLGMAARFSTAKRQDLLVELVAWLNEHAANVQWELSLPGIGEERLRIEELAECRAPGRVHFPGLLSQPELACWLRSLDIYLHASDGETLSTSMLQAMATGLPLVASNVPGIDDLLTPGTGLRVGNGDLDAWGNAVVDLCADPRKRADLAHNARATAEADYSMQAMRLRYEAVLERAVQ